MRTTRLLTTAVVLLCCAMSWAQEDTEIIRGQVYSAEGSESTELPGANVHWAGTELGTSTDSEGKFAIERSPHSSILVVSFTGFIPDSVPVAGESDLRILLKTGLELATVDVVEREESSSLFLLDPLNVQKMGGKELRKAACCNLSESFETNASVDASFTDAVTGTRQIKMLGLSGRYSQILKDNIPNVRGLSTIYPRALSEWGTVVSFTNCSSGVRDSSAFGIFPTASGVASTKE